MKLEFTKKADIFDAVRAVMKTALRDNITTVQFDTTEINKSGFFFHERESSDLFLALMQSGFIRQFNPDDDFISAWDSDLAYQNFYSYDKIIEKLGNDAVLTEAEMSELIGLYEFYHETFDLPYQAPSTIQQLQNLQTFFKGLKHEKYPLEKDHVEIIDRYLYRKMDNHHFKLSSVCSWSCMFKLSEKAWAAWRQALENDVPFEPYYDFSHLEPFITEANKRSFLSQVKVLDLREEIIRVIDAKDYSAASALFASAENRELAREAMRTDNPYRAEMYANFFTALYNYEIEQPSAPEWISEYLEMALQQLSEQPQDERLRYPIFLAIYDHQKRQGESSRAAFLAALPALCNPKNDNPHILEFGDEESQKSFDYILHAALGNRGYLEKPFTSSTRVNNFFQVLRDHVNDQCSNTAENGQADITPPSCYPA